MTFPAEDRAGPRLRRIRLGRRVLDLLTVLAPRHTPPIPRDIDAFLSVVYPLGYRRAWPTAPAVPPELAQPEADVLAELAVRAPFGSYLRRSASGAGEGAYEIDLRWMNAYPAREGLAPPGGLARFAVRDGHLGTVSVQQDGVPTDLARAALLAGLNEDLTTFRHNVSVHLATLTSFALASTNQLGGRPPRPPTAAPLLQHGADRQRRARRVRSSAGPRGFSATIFSHEGHALLAHGPRPRRAGSTSGTSSPTRSSPGAAPPRRRSPIPTATTSCACGRRRCAYVEDYLAPLLRPRRETSRRTHSSTRWAAELDRAPAQRCRHPGSAGSPSTGWPGCARR